jgi:hypothetical protein
MCNVLALCLTNLLQGQCVKKGLDTLLHQQPLDSDLVHSTIPLGYFFLFHDSLLEFPLPKYLSMMNFVFHLYVIPRDNKLGCHQIRFSFLNHSCFSIFFLLCGASLMFSNGFPFLFCMQNWSNYCSRWRLIVPSAEIK